MDVIGNCRRYEQEQRVYELQRELEFSNATLRKMTVTWEIYEEPPAKTKKLEEEEKNTTAQRIGRAFRERKRCRELVYCCTLIQKVFRGFLSRRIFRELKGQRSKNDPRHFHKLDITSGGVRIRHGKSIVIRSWRRS